MKTFRNILLLGAAVFLSLGALTTASAHRGYYHHGYYRYHRGGSVYFNPAPVYSYSPYYYNYPYYGYSSYPYYGGGVYFGGGGRWGGHWGGGHWGGHHHR